MSLFNNVIASDGAIVGMKSSGVGGDVMESIRRNNDPYEKIIDLLPRLTTDVFKRDYRHDIKECVLHAEVSPLLGFGDTSKTNINILQTNRFTCSFGNFANGQVPILLPTEQRICSVGSTGLRDFRFPLTMPNPGDGIISINGKINISNLYLSLRSSISTGAGCTWTMELCRSKTVNEIKVCDITQVIKSQTFLASANTLTSYNIGQNFNVDPGEVLWIRFTHSVVSTGTITLYSYIDPMSTHNFFANPYVASQRIKEFGNSSTSIPSINTCISDSIKELPIGLTYAYGKKLEFLLPEIYFNNSPYSISQIIAMGHYVYPLPVISINDSNKESLSKYSIYIDLDKYNIIELQKIIFTSNITGSASVKIAIVDRFDEVLYDNIQSGEDLSSKELPGRYSLKITYYRANLSSNAYLTSLQIQVVKLNSAISKTIVPTNNSLQFAFSVKRVRGVGIVRSYKLPDGYPLDNNNLNRIIVILDGKMYNISQFIERTGATVGLSGSINMPFYRTLELAVVYQQAAGDYSYLSDIAMFFDIDYLED